MPKKHVKAIGSFNRAILILLTIFFTFIITVFLAYFIFFSWRAYVLAQESYTHYQKGIEHLQKGIRSIESKDFSSSEDELNKALEPWNRYKLWRSYASILRIILRVVPGKSEFHKMFLLSDQTILEKKKMLDKYQGGVIAFNGHQKDIEYYMVSQDRLLLLTGSKDGTTRLWNIKTGKCIRAFKDDFEERNLVCISSDNSLVSTSSFEKKQAKVFDTESGKCIQTINSEGNIRHAIFSSDASFLYTEADVETYNGSISIIEIWDIQSGKLVNKLRYEKQISFTNVSAKGLLFVVDSGTICQYDDEATQPKKTYFFQYDVERLAISKDESLLAVILSDHSIELLDIKSGECLSTFVGHDKKVGRACLSPDNTLLGSASEDNTVRLWAVESGKCLGVFHTEYPFYRAQTILISPDSSLLVVSSDDEILIWDISTKKMIKEFPEQADVVFFSSNGDLLACNSSSKSVYIWKLEKRIIDDYVRRRFEE